MNKSSTFSSRSINSREEKNDANPRGKPQSFEKVLDKTIIAIVIVAVAVLGGYFLVRGAYRKAPAVPQTSSKQTAPQPSRAQSPTAEEKAVTYTDSGYSPSMITIKKGETITFKNQSSRSMWTASAFHPTHREYPTTGGCLGSTFDACRGIQPNNSWSFTFDIKGTWKYHDHLSPADTGTVIVE